MINKQENKRVKVFWKELEALQKDTESYLFPREDGTFRMLDDLMEDTTDVLDDTAPVGITFDILHACSGWKLKYTFYELMEKHNKQQAIKMYEQSVACGYLATKNSALTYGCLPNNEFELMDQITLYMAQAFIAGWSDEASQIAEIMIESINHGEEHYDKDGNRIRDRHLIGAGIPLAPGSWFMLELYCKFYNRDFDRKNARYPESMYPYDEVLAHLDSKDLSEVDKYVYMLSTMHLDQAKEQLTEDDYFEFRDSSRQLFPYEILMWLKLREQKGLSNPKSFTHPLMKTPIAKFFLNLETPLPKPTKLSFAKALLEKLKAQCPNVEIPEWLEKMPSSHEILPEDFMK